MAGSAAGAGRLNKKKRRKKKLAGCRGASCWLCREETGRIECREMSDRRLSAGEDNGC